MKVVIQRSLKSTVLVNQKQVGAIEKGMVLLVGFTEGDCEKDIDLMINKILGLRIFDDENGIMNKSIIDIDGEILSVSQFTLYADTSHGRRPSYVKALNRNEAIKLYEIFNQKLSEKIKIATGVFGVEMVVNITNDGPVTIILESEDL